MSDKNEMLIRAKNYLELLANGHDPFTGDALPEDTVLNNVRLSRCFYFVNDILRQVIENGGEVTRVSRNRNLPFSITEEQKAKIELSDEPLQISDFASRINEQVDENTQGRLKVTAFGAWLVDKGFMRIETHNDKNYKRPTDSGIQFGILSEWREYGDKGYYRVTYSRDAQQFLLDNLDEIIAVSNG